MGGGNAVRAALLLLLMVWCLVPCVAGTEGIAPAEARALAGRTVAWLTTLESQVTDEHFHTGKWDLSVAACERMITLNPVGITPYGTAAWLLWSMGKTEQAIALYRRMIAANPTDPAAYFEIGQYYYFHAKNYPEALKWLEQGIKLGLTGRNSHLYGHVLEKVGRLTDAMAFWEQAAAKEPANEVPRQQLTRLRALLSAPAPPVAPPPDTTTP